MLSTRAPRAGAASQFHGSIRAAVSPRATPDPIHILCLCAGNYCRSPIAQALLRLRLWRAGIGSQFAVSSAGTLDAHAGKEAPAPTLQVIAEMGAVGFHWQPRQATTDDVARADLVLAMAGEHRDWVAQTLPTAAPRALLLAQAARLDFDVPDPNLQHVDAIRPVAYIIDALVRDGLNRIASLALLNWMQRTERMKAEGGRMNEGLTQTQELAALNEVVAAQAQLAGGA